MPNNGQYWHVYGTEGAVDLSTATFYRRGRGTKPEVLVPPQPREEGEPHIAAFFESIRTGAKPVAGIDVGATAALTAIMGRDAIYGKRMMTWSDMGVNL
jgi:hypothetical protein